MNIITSTKKVALVAGVLGVCGLGFLAPSASAKPNRDVKEARRDVKRERKDLQRAQQDLQRERRENRNTNRPRTIVVRPRTVVVRPAPYRRPTVARPATYIGRVVSVSGRRININVGGNRFYVDSVSGLPRQLNRGDQVRVVGIRSGNTIRNARVSLVRNY